MEGATPIETSLFRCCMWYFIAYQGGRRSLTKIFLCHEPFRSEARDVDPGRHGGRHVRCTVRVRGCRPASRGCGQLPASFHRRDRRLRRRLGAAHLHRAGRQRRGRAGRRDRRPVAHHPELVRRVDPRGDGDLRGDRLDPLAAPVPLLRHRRRVPRHCHHPERHLPLGHQIAAPDRRRGDADGVGQHRR